MCAPRRPSLPAPAAAQRHSLASLAQQRSLADEAALNKAWDQTTSAGCHALTTTPCMLTLALFNSILATLDAKSVIGTDSQITSTFNDMDSNSDSSGRYSAGSAAKGALAACVHRAWDSGDGAGGAWGAWS